MYDEYVENHVLPGGHSLLTEDETKALLRRAQAGDESAAEEIIRHNQRFVIFIANRYYKHGIVKLDLDDMIQIGNIGLMKAIKRWDESKNNRFITFAYYWIMSYIRRQTVKNSSDVTVSYNMAEKIASLKIISSDCMAENRKPTIQYLSERSGIPIEEVELAMLSSRQTLSIERKTAQGDGPDLAECIPDSIDVEGDALQAVLIAQAIELLDDLPEKERQVIIRRYNIDGKGIATQKEIAEELNITHQSISLIEKKALKYMKRRMSERSLNFCASQGL